MGWNIIALGMDLFSPTGIITSYLNYKQNVGYDVLAYSWLHILIILFI